MTTALIIHHFGCADGFCSAFLLHEYLLKAPLCDDIEVMSAQYGDDPPDVTDKSVFILDFSYPRMVLHDMAAKAKSIVVLDHHGTTEEELRNVGFAYFNKLLCGAQLTFDFIEVASRQGRNVMDKGGIAHCLCEMDRQPPSYAAYPKLVQYVADRDLWKWELDNSKEASAHIQSTPKTFEDWRQLDYDFKVNPATIATNGAAILRYQNITTKFIADKAYPVKLGCCNETILAANTCVLQSEVGHILAEKADVGLCWYRAEDGRYHYSLRSMGDVNVAMIAKFFGGGGHKHAAGFESIHYVLDPDV